MTIRCILIFYMGILAPLTLMAQTPPDSSESWSYHFQFTSIAQGHPAFSAPYSGQNSLQSESEEHFSITSTLFVGTHLWAGGEFFVNPEIAGGSGISSTLGVAGFPNGEVYRVGATAPDVIVARVFIRQNFGLGGEMESIAGGQNVLTQPLPSSRLTLTLGKFGLMDIFDDNAYSHDPRSQFMNWSLMGHGAWDYAADTKGYNYGVALQLKQPNYALNFALVMEPSYANGPIFDSRIIDANSWNLEFVKPYSLGGREGKLHLVGFLNHAHMGLYSDAIASAVLPPDITKSEAYRTKYGFAIALEQPLSDHAGLFARASWNDGKTETWAFTEIDQSFSIGINSDAALWNRPEDHAGIAVVANGLSVDHRKYLESGGYGFLIGDGKLNYAPEAIFEAFYNLRLAPTFWLTLDNQCILNPAYNKDRGPFVEVYAVRGHVEF